MLNSPARRPSALSQTQSLALLVACLACIGCGRTENQSVDQISVPPNPSEVATGETLDETAAVDQSPSLEISSIDEPTKKLGANAEAYLAHLDDRTKPSHEAELSKSEIRQIAEVLRASYPLESIRERMSFQMKTPESRGGADRRTIALRLLHSDYVTTFISEPGVGITRIPRISPTDLRSYRYWTASKIVSEEVGSTLLAEPPVELDPEEKTRESRMRIHMGEQFPDPDHFNQLSPNGLPKQQLVSEFDKFAKQYFAEKNLGYVKNLEEVAGFEHHQLKMPIDWNQNLRSSATQFEQADDSPLEETRWKVNRLQLVSLLMHEDPVIYVTDELPNMEKLSSSNAETRSLSAFETDGLESLQSGESLHIQATQNRIVMMGAIRADAACCQCHAVETDSLLGAFSYEFLRSPKAGQ